MRDLIKTENIKGFEINTYFEPEHIHPDDLYDYKELGGEKYRTDLLDGIESGRYLWVIAIVTVSKLGIELGNANIGGLLLDSSDDFFRDTEHYDDLVTDAIFQANYTIELLVRGD